MMGGVAVSKKETPFFLGGFAMATEAERENARDPQSKRKTGRNAFQNGWFEGTALQARDTNALDVIR